VKRYLWAVGDWIKAYQVGELIEERYFLHQPRVLLDTLPAQPGEGPNEIPAYISPYLKLLPWRLHLPQIYDYFPSSDPEIDLSVWLLDYGTIPLTEEGEPVEEELLPSLGSLWASAAPMVQLNWLWQISRLWQPLQSKGVVSSLLEKELLKVNGYQVQLRELRIDEHQFYELRHLAPILGPLLEQCQSTIAPFCETLKRKLEQGKIPHADHLLKVIETAIADLAQQSEYKYQTLTITDPGPSREHNEDACYPPSQLLGEGNQLLTTLTLICDGVGGQEGGEVASQWVAEHLPLSITGQIKGQTESQEMVLETLKTCIERVNEQLNTRNDNEQRRERERMGTTLVMALAQHQHLYLGNVGDSRCYWLTPSSCLQMTVDDDLACREVRLGYMLYRDALELPRSGALTQAIGLGPSNQLHPALQHFLVPAESLFLLCSDGLSDFNRIEQYWQTLVAPLFKGEQTLTEIGDHLIALANTQNGHDNVTIGLLYCQLVTPDTLTPIAYPRLGYEQDTHPPVVEAPTPKPSDPPPEPLTVPTPPPPVQQLNQNIILPPWVFALLLGLLTLGVGWWGWQTFLAPSPSPQNSPGSQS